MYVFNCTNNKPRHCKAPIHSFFHSEFKIMRKFEPSNIRSQSNFGINNARINVRMAIGKNIRAG